MANWIFDDYDEMGRHYHCSKCGYGIMVIGNLPDKCSNCKAEMEMRKPRAIDATSLKDKFSDIYGDSNNLVYLYGVLDLIDAQPTFIQLSKSPMTNADRIRAMSDEELAGYLARISGDTAIKMAEQFGLTLDQEKKQKYIDKLKSEYLKRLQQPVEEDI